MRAAIGETVDDFGSISSSYKSARHTRHVAENYRHPPQMRRIVGVRDVKEPLSYMDKALELQSLYDRLKYADLGDFQEQTLEYVESLKAVNACIPLDGGYLRSEVLMTAYRIIQEAGGDPRKVLDPQWLSRSPGPDDLEGYTSQALAVMHRAIKFRESNGSVKGNPAVNKARRYLENNFTNPNLTFQDVVDHVAMSSSHFSTLFSQTTGMTFTKYLIDLRMSKARELLYSTAMRSSEIAYAVGYNDPHYFSYLFKKCSGVTPSEFRTGMLKGNEGDEPV